MELTLIIVWYFQFTFFAFLFAWHTDSIKKKLDNIIWNTRPPLPDPPPSDILPPEEIDAMLTSFGDDKDKGEKLATFGNAMPM